MNVNGNIISWIHSYLTDRPQYTKVNNIKSDVICTNMGAPQGCGLAPTVFVLYTNDCVSNYSSCSVIKYADDTAILGKINGDNVEEYLAQVNDFTIWCRQNYLDLNVKKNKEMISDFRKNRVEPDNIVINSEPVEIVTQYKYIGVIIDNQLSGSENTDMVYKKCQQRLHFTRVLKKLQIEYYNQFIL